MYKLMMSVLKFEPPSIPGGDSVEGEQGARTALQYFFDNSILTWIAWGVTMLFVILVIKAGVSIGMAKSPEEKQAAKGKLLSLAIGLAIVFSASVAVTVLSSMFASMWGSN